MRKTVLIQPARSQFRRVFIKRETTVEYQRQRTGQRGPAPPSLHQHIAAYGTTLDVDDEERDDLPLASSNRFPVAPSRKGEDSLWHSLLSPRVQRSTPRSQPRTGAGSFWPTCPAFRETVLGGPRSIPETEAA